MQQPPSSKGSKSRHKLRRQRVPKKQKQKKLAPKKHILWWNIAKLRLSAAQPSLRVRRRLTARQRGLCYFFALGACAVLALVSVMLAALLQGMPELRALDGTALRGDELVVLDPNRRDETMLSSGTLYDRPVAVVLTGGEPVLVRLRLEETILSLRRDDNGLVITPKASPEPGSDDVQRTITQEAALQLLINNGFVEKGTSWSDALKQKLPARKLPGGENEGGRLLVFEKKTVTINEDAAPGTDFSALLPEDIEKMQLNTTTWSYQGFYYVEDASGEFYQPLHFELQSDPNTPNEPPTIKGITYEYFQWDVTQSSVRVIGDEAQESPVELQLGEALQPLAAWTEPTDGWFYDRDGWIYYGRALPSGTMTPLVMDSFSVDPASAIALDEARFRLNVRAQSSPVDRQMVIDYWHSGIAIEGLGSNSISDEAANFILALLEG